MADGYTALGGRWSPISKGKVNYTITATGCNPWPGKGIFAGGIQDVAAK